MPTTHVHNFPPTPVVSLPVTHTYEFFLVCSCLQVENAALFKTWGNYSSFVTLVHSVSWEQPMASKSNHNLNGSWAFGTRFVLLVACFTFISCLAYSLALKMEAIYSFEMLVHFHCTRVLHRRRQRTLLPLILHQSHSLPFCKRKL
jgi:hypothetical protein